MPAYVVSPVLYRKRRGIAKQVECAVVMRLVTQEACGRYSGDPRNTLFCKSCSSPFRTGRGPSLVEEVAEPDADEVEATYPEPSLYAECMRLVPENEFARMAILCKELTMGQTRVLEQLAKGLNNREILDQLRLPSDANVTNAVVHIYQKLGVAHFTEHSASSRRLKRAMAAIAYQRFSAR